MTLPNPIQMTDEEYFLLDELISGHCGIHFSETKRPLLESRLNPRLHALGLTRFIDYYMLLQCEPGNEFDELAHAVTNNETYFFREVQPFEALMQELTSEDRGAWPKGAARVLCAGCSSGEEAYTLQMYAKTRAPGVVVQIDAFDVDRARVQIARRAEYRPRSIRGVSEEQLRDHFLRTGPDRYTVAMRYRENVDFHYGNILDVSTFPARAPYDIVCCRNVLIYFSEEAIRLAIDHFASVLRPGGLLLLGHSESIIGLSSSFDTRRLGRSIVYERTDEESRVRTNVRQFGTRG